MTKVNKQTLVPLVYEAYSNRYSNISEVRKTILRVGFGTQISNSTIDSEIDELLSEYRRRGGTQLEETIDNIIAVYTKNKPEPKEDDEFKIDPPKGLFSP